MPSVCTLAPSIEVEATVRFAPRMPAGRADPGASGGTV